VIEPMLVSDIPAVSAVERLSFPQPWPQSAYRREILENRMAYYVVARLRETAHAPAAPHAPATRPRAEQRPGGDVRAEEGLFGRLQRLFRAQDVDAAPGPARDVVGYAGLWLMTDEAHVTTIAVRPEYRGMYIGELLLVNLIDRAIAIGARWVTLEVRVSNDIAQRLYRKYTFKEMGVRRRYYSDNGEDALIMWTDQLDSDRFRQALETNRSQLAERLGGLQ
jgi:ribosomal-protein-alanine N-acetyltransferase